MKLLLHACCGPCSLEPSRILLEQDCDFTVFYANSNIHPEQEYLHRRDTLQDIAERIGFSVVEGVYDPAAWEQSVGVIGSQLEQLRAQAGIQDELVESPNPYPLAPPEEKDQATQEARNKAAALRKARCRACYRLRFEEAARYAAENGYDALGSTLSVSPFQYTDVIREELDRAAKKAGITSAFVDYRPYFNAAEERSKAMGVYRQNFCGCHFSDEEAQQERAIRKAARKAKKKALKAAKLQAAQNPCNTSDE